MQGWGRFSRTSWVALISLLVLVITWLFLGSGGFVASQAPTPTPCQGQGSAGPSSSLAPTFLPPDMPTSDEVAATVTPITATPCPTVTSAASPTAIASPGTRVPLVREATTQPSTALPTPTAANDLGLLTPTPVRVRPQIRANVQTSSTINVAAGDLTGFLNAIAAVNAGTANDIELGGGVYDFSSVPSFTAFGGNNLPLKFVINGNGSIIDGGSITRELFSFRVGVTAELHNITFEHGGSADLTYDGVMLNRGTLYIYDSTFDSNQTMNGGAAILNLGGTLNILRTTFSNNISGNGAAIQDNGGPVSILCSRFLDNNDDGTALWAVGGASVSIHKSLFQGNTSTIYGAAAVANLDSPAVDADKDNYWGTGGLPAVSDEPSVDSIGEGVTVNSVAASDPTIGPGCAPAAAAAPLNSSVTISSDKAAADGQSPLTVQATMVDINNQPMPFTVVNLSSTDSDLTFNPVSGYTDKNGVFTAQITSTAITNGVVEVQVGAVSVGSAIARFQAGDVAVSIDGLSTILAGENVVYAIHAKNVGFLPLHNVTVLAGLPIGQVTYEAEQQPDDVQFVSQSSNQVSWAIPDLEAGDSRVVYVVGHSVTSLTLGTMLTFGAQVGASPDADNSNNEATFVTTIAAAHAPTTVVQPSKLNIAFTAAPSTAVVGESITMTVRVSNATTAETLYNVEAFSRLRGLVPTLVLNWPDPQHPGELLPGQAAIATFPYTIAPDFPNLATTAEYAWASAADSDPSDGAPLVAANGTLTGLTVNGPGVIVSVVADKPTASVGDRVHYTVTVTNNANRNDSAAQLSLKDTLTGQTDVLTPTGPLAPGQSATATFSYTVQAADAPQFTAWATVSGQGVTYPTAIVAASGRVIVKVNISTGGTVNLALDGSNTPPVLLPGVSIHLPLFIALSGTPSADNVTLRLNLPPGVILVDQGPGGDSHSYNPDTGKATWTWNSLTEGTSVSPVIQVTVPLGTTLDFDVVVSSTTPETSLDDNALTLSLPVVAAAPTKSTLVAVNRSFVVADGKDAITLQLTALNQLGMPMPNLGATLLADQPGVTLSEQSVTTDSNGQAQVLVSATETGPVDITATLNASVVVSATLQRRSGPLAVVNSPLTLGVGGTDSLDIQVLNNTTLGDNFNLSVSGLDALDPASYQFQNSPVALGPGQFATVHLVFTLPSDQCSIAGTYPITITATGSGGSVLGTADASVQILPAAPALSAVLPAPNTRVGSTQVFFSWRSNTPGTSTVFVRPQGSTGDYTPYTLFANSQDPTLYSATVSLPQGAYEWYGTMDTACGTTTTGSDSTPLPFAVVQAVSFVNRSYSFTIGDDYDITKDIHGAPLSITVRNDDTVPHKVQVTVNSPYSDLIVGFIGSGSLDQAATLQPGEIRTLTLHVFTQQIQQTQYGLTLSLVTDNATDSVPLTLVIQRPTPNITFTTVSTDPTTMVTTARLTNHGPTVTDLDFDVVQPGTGIPANVSVQPDIHHVYLPAETSAQFQIIPLALNNTGLAYTPLPSSDKPVSLMLPTKTSKVQAISMAGPFDGKICAAGTCITQTNVFNNVCPTGEQVYSYTNSEPLIFTATSSAWYCTNKPNIDIPLNLPVVWGPNSTILESTLSADFAPGSLGDQSISHEVSLSFNGTYIGGATVPDTSSVTLAIPSDAWLSESQQIINLRSGYPAGNQAHFTRNTNNQILAVIQNSRSLFCALGQADADAAEQNYLLQHRLEPTVCTQSLLGANIYASPNAAIPAESDPNKRAQMAVAPRFQGSISIVGKYEGDGGIWIRVIYNNIQYGWVLADAFGSHSDDPCADGRGLQGLPDLSNDGSPIVPTPTPTPAPTETPTATPTLLPGITPTATSMPIIDQLVMVPQVFTETTIDQCTNDYNPPPARPENAPLIARKCWSQVSLTTLVDEQPGGTLTYRRLFEILVIGEYGQFLGDVSSDYKQAADNTTEIIARRFYQTCEPNGNTSGCTPDQLLQFLAYFQDPNNDTFPRSDKALQSLETYSDPVGYPGNVAKLQDIKGRVESILITPDQAWTQGIQDNSPSGYGTAINIDVNRLTDFRQECGTGFAIISLPAPPNSNIGNIFFTTTPETDGVGLCLGKKYP